MKMFTEKNSVFVVQPASCGTTKQFEALKKLFQTRGWRVLNKPNLSKRHEYLADDDSKRLTELENAFKSNCEAVVCLRGGYGSQRLLPLLKKPFSSKPFLGFSDITALQATGAVMNSIHGSWSWLRSKVSWRVFTSICERKPILVELSNKPSRAIVEGVAIAGNLSVLTDLLGTPFLQPPKDDFVLFLEDTNEPPYRIDRMFFQLLNSGFLKRCVGLALGNFDYRGAVIKPAVIASILKNLGCKLPMVYFPFGHRGKGLIPIPQFWYVRFLGRKVEFDPC